MANAEVGIDFAARRLAKDVEQPGVDHGSSRGAADQKNLVDLRRGQGGRIERSVDCAEGFLDEWRDRLLIIRARQLEGYPRLPAPRIAPIKLTCRRRSVIAQAERVLLFH